MKRIVLASILIFSCLAMESVQAQQRPPGGGEGGRPEGGQGSPGGGGRPGGEGRPGGDGGPDGGDGGRPGGGAGRPGEENGGRPRLDATENLQNAEQNLQALIAEREISPIDIESLSLPDISEPKPQLGKQLFFAKNLGGEQSAACVTCHHPTLGGGDDISLSVGVDAVNELNNTSHNLLGHGRFNGRDADNLPSVPRNAPTIFNTGLNSRSMFWDGRVETRRNGEILTPDSQLDELGRRLADSNLPEGATLAAAQARFPVTSEDEMRGDFALGDNNQILRELLTQRFDNTDSNFSSTWPIAFEQAYGDSEVSFDRIADAIGEYERSMLFVNSPWQAYLNGDSDALTQEQKAGAVVFFSSRRDGGGGCATCHSGSTFSSPRNRLVAFPQFGPGKGNESNTATSHDFGRENITGAEEDRFHFRTPSLLNVAVTAPYGHTGAYQTLEEVVNHYSNPRAAIDRLFAAQGGVPFVDGIAPFCELPQISQLMEKNNQGCESLYPDAYANSMATVDHLESARRGDVAARSPLRRSPRLSPELVAQLVSFLNALTDPCVEDRNCLAPWIVDEINEADFPDNNPLIGHDQDSIAL